MCLGFKIPLEGEFSDDTPEDEYILVMDGIYPVSTCRLHYLDEHTEMCIRDRAGSVALLTMVTTKWKTVKLSVARVVTFIISVLMALIIFSAVESEWMAYGIYVFFVVIIAEMLGWGATISVNALIGMHFLEVRDFEFDFIANEFMLVLIGITMALVLNLFYDYGSQRKALVENMRYTDCLLYTSRCV